MIAKWPDGSHNIVSWEGRMNRKRPTRYAIRQEFDATWTVYDIFTGVPYSDNGSIAVEMPLEFAERLAFLLNLEYRLRWRL